MGHFINPINKRKVVKSSHVMKSSNYVFIPYTIEEKELAKKQKEIKKKHKADARDDRALKRKEYKKRCKKQFSDKSNFYKEDQPIYTKNGKVDFKEFCEKKSITKIKMSSGERAICEALKLENIEYVFDQECTDLINPKTKKALRFDFFLPKLNAVIEFDGIQHFKFSPTFHTGGISDFSDQRYRDKLKNKYCIDKKIKLLRIKYNQNKEVNKIIEDFLKNIII